MRFEVLAALIVKGSEPSLIRSVVTIIETPQFPVQPCTHVIIVRRIWLKNLNIPKFITLSSSCLKASGFERRLYSLGPTYRFMPNLLSPFGDSGFACRLIAPATPIVGPRSDK